MVRGCFVHCQDLWVLRWVFVQWSVERLLQSLPPPPIPYFSSFHCFVSVTVAWNGGSCLGCGDLPAMGAVFYLGAGWPWWKPLGIPGSHLPLEQGSWLIDMSSFFGLSHCIPCSPSWRFCTTLITSCKRPILLQLVIYLILGWLWKPQQHLSEYYSCSLP